jgi:hypothetical protein
MLLMKKFIIGFLVGIMLFSTVSATADLIAKQVNYPIRINGKVFNPEKPVVSINGSTYLALRDIGNALDVKVAWNDKAKSIEIGEASDTITDTIPTDTNSNTIIKNAKSNELYNPREVVKIGDKLGVAIEGFRYQVTNYSYASNLYYLLIDFSIINLSKSDYNSVLSNFVLSDSADYTYDPFSGIAGKGNIEGIIKYKDMRRGEIAFAVPMSERKFELRFTTNDSIVKTVRFSIDVNTVIPKQDNAETTPDTNDSVPTPTPTPEPVLELDPMQPIDQ